MFFDVAIGGHSVGRVKMELFNDICPKVSDLVVIGYGRLS